MTHKSPVRVEDPRDEEDSHGDDELHVSADVQYWPLHKLTWAPMPTAMQVIVLFVAVADLHLAKGRRQLSRFALLCFASPSVRSVDAISLCNAATWSS